jgi:hypothetical protein
MKPTSLPFLAIALLATFAAAPAGANGSFAQSNQTVAPAAADARRLATYLTPPYKAGPMPPAVEQILLRAATAELRTGCAATVDRFGPAAHGSSRVSMHILAVAGGSAWVTYRCDSRLPEFDGLYSERLAVFNSTRRVIQFLDLRTGDDTADTLYHVGLSETVKMRGAENSAIFQVFAMSPSRDRAGPPRRAENRMVVIANSPTRAQTALSVVTVRHLSALATTGDDASAAAPEAPAGGTYHAAIHFDHDLTGHLTVVVVYYRDTGARSGVTRYEWSPTALRFAVARPIPLPPVGAASPREPPAEQPPVPLPPVTADGPLAH